MTRHAALKTTRKQPQQPRSRATVGVILDAAIRVLDREGLEAMTTSRVAEVAGVSVGTLYQYFAHRDAIIDACDKAGVKLATIFPSRFHDSSREIKKAVDAKRFGKLTIGDAYVKWFRTQQYYDSGKWRGTWELGFIGGTAGGPADLWGDDELQLRGSRGGKPGGD